MYFWNDATLYVFVKRANYNPTTQPTYCDATHSFPREMESDDRAEKFHTDDVLLP